MRFKIIFPQLAFLLLFAILKVEAQNVTPGPRVLVVVAHPDDESIFSVTLYKIAKEQHGTVDLFVITDGEAGYKYSTLAEEYYHVELTDKKAGQANLPRIRKKELRNAGNIIGVSNYYFEDQTDAHYGLDEKEPLDTSWNIALIKRNLNRVLSKKHYDFVLCLLPDSSTHGEHKAATLLSLDVIAGLPENNRPVILAATTRNKTDQICRFSAYKDYSETSTLTDTPLFKVDRTTCFGYRNKINYKIIANWELAEHKTQGFTQMTMNDGDLEEFWYFKLNGKAGIDKCVTLFNSLKQTPYLSKTY
ncbi:GlcNAc-PI de-N-acetylase [Mucilaginibacter frigoritolerans]|uniref:GlcNAc-PI de-N-acetylase n=1 Tax=Mucilaginibacter frigoritolerans TaxID=652788 RepID=A0A562TWT4_9SPHI|nr:PIG-L family deacetylase [Mucilaginibacter frigoritolerans]TWI97564.1 GlcNAc-PI de-N-acetylase [Mucilaginibacter frigoritolerans]